MAGTRVVKTRAVRVTKLGHHQIRETNCLLQPSSVKRRPVESEQTVDEKGVVLQEATDASVTVLPAAKKSTVTLQSLQNEPGIAHRDVAKFVPPENARAVAERSEHQSVPAGDHLFVSTRALALLSDLEQTPLDASNRFGKRGLGNPKAVGDVGGGAWSGQNRAPFEITVRLYVEPHLGNCGVVAKRLIQLRRSPGVEQPLVPCGIGIERGVEPAV